MLITLSSQGENDPALFQNTFSEAFVIEPNSYVCLISASILESWTNGTVNVPGGTTMTIRFDAYNCQQVVLNINDAIYNLDDFITHLNSLFSSTMTNSLGSRFLATLETDPNIPNQAQIHFNLYRTLADDNVNYLKYIYPANTSNPSFRQQQNSNFVTIPSSANLSADLTAAGFVKALPITADYNFAALAHQASAAPGSTNIALITNGPIVDYGTGILNYVMENINNRDSFQHLRGFKMENPNWTDPNDAPYSMFVIANSPSRNKLEQDNHSFIYRIGNTTYDNVSNEYTDLSLDGTNLSLEFKDTGKVALNLANRDTGNEDIVSLTNYNFGNQYKVGISIDETPGAGARGIPNVVEFDYSGLVFWIPGTNTYTGGDGEPPGTTDMNWNSRYIYSYPGINFLYENQNLELANINLPGRFVSTATTRSADNSQMGCWASTGFQQSTSYSHINEASRYVDNGLNEVISVSSYTGFTFSDFTQALARYDRRFFADGPGNTSTKRRHVRLRPNGLRLDTLNPICFTCLIIMIDDSGVITAPATYDMTIFGGVAENLTTNYQVIKLSLNQVATGSGHDITLTDIDGNIFTHTLTNPISGARINILPGFFYMFSYQDDGAKNYKIQLVDMHTEIPYTANGTLTGASLPYIESWGGMNDISLAPAENWFSGHVADLRFYSKPFRSDITINEWDFLIESLLDSYKGGPPAYSNEIVGKPTMNNIYVGGESKYAEFSQPNSDETTTPYFIANNVVVENQPVNLYSFTDVFLPIQVTLPFVKRTRDLPLKALTGVGNGLVEAAGLNAEFTLDNYDAVNERVIEPYVWTDTLDPYFSNIGEVADIDLDDKVFNVEIKNLPHRSINGVNKSFDKTIYQIPVEQGIKKNNLTIHEHSPANKVWIPLKNPGELPLNQIEVQISKNDGKKAEGLVTDTHLVIQVETREDIL